MLGNLNPLFEEKYNQDKNKERIEVVSKKQTSRKRNMHFDKAHDVKFPVSIHLRKELKSSLKRFKYYFPEIEIRETKYNTLLLLYALQNIHIVNWEQDYCDSKNYMHTKPPEFYYQEIGGLNGIAMENGISDRRAVYMMVTSALKDIEKGDNYSAIFQRLQSIKRKVTWF
ncbi:hypothetical protein V1503_24405 [Bacillus sp. SCS-151]|uniref:hypothetical protein n=1 Tax=Nanhaiella sioensis TaxID=3115293 RepID=UPI00397B299F